MAMDYHRKKDGWKRRQLRRHPSHLPPWWRERRHAPWDWLRSCRWHEVPGRNGWVPRPGRWQPGQTKSCSVDSYFSITSNEELCECVRSVQARFYLRQSIDLFNITRILLLKEMLVYVQKEKPLQF